MHILTEVLYYIYSVEKVFRADAAGTLLDRLNRKSIQRIVIMSKRKVSRFEKYRRMARNELSGSGRAKTASGEDKGIVMHLSTSDPEKLVNFFGENPEEGAGVIDALIESIMSGEMVPDGKMALPMPGAPVEMEEPSGKGGGSGESEEEEENGENGKSGKSEDNGKDKKDKKDKKSEENGGDGDSAESDEDSDEKEASMPVRYRIAKRGTMQFLKADGTKEANEDGDGRSWGAQVGQLLEKLREIDPDAIIDYVRNNPEIAAGIMGAAGGGALGGLTGQGAGNRLGRAGLGAVAGGAVGAGGGHLSGLIRDWLAEPKKKDQGDI